MKKTIIVLIIVILMMLASGYAENSYCHYWTTATPPGVSESEYIHNTGLCKINAYPSLLGAIFLGWLN